YLWLSSLLPPHHMICHLPLTILLITLLSSRSQNYLHDAVGYVQTHLRSMLLVTPCSEPPIIYGEAVCDRRKRDTLPRVFNTGCRLPRLPHGSCIEARWKQTHSNALTQIGSR
ncbi:hypothetical protein FS749_003782, partial [Ceratobasidium sp. UAMH 11750]